MGARFPGRPSGIAALAAALVLGGCTAGPVPPRPDDALATRADPLERILRQAEREADPQRQADAYFRALMLARSTREDMVPALVERLRSPRQPNTASLARALSATRQHELLGVALELALARSDEAEIVRLLRLLAGGDAEQSALTRRARAMALGRLGEHWAAAQALMEVLAQPGVADAAAIATTVWRHLSRVSVAELNRQARAAAAPATAAWAALARDVYAGLTPSAAARTWRTWRARHPDHPAARHPPTVLAQPGARRRSIALLLPLTGELAGLGEEVRDGFLAAYLHGEPEDQDVTLYDTAGGAATDAYNRAVAHGADVVVGPLDKAAVAAIFALAPQLPLVALNTPARDAEAPKDAVQLALAVEDEAAAVRAALATSDLRRIVVFQNETSWAGRASANLAGDAGLDIVATGRLRDMAATTDVAAEALAVVESTARHAAIERLVGAELKFTPRRRDDVDAIVAFVEADELLALKPALEFHFAGDLPLYVWSRVPRGNAAANIRGVRVCDIPWRLFPDALHAEASAAFPARRVDSPMFALGVDGYRVANQLGRMTAHGESIAGSTGMLTLTANGRIHRELACAVAGDTAAPRAGS